MGSKLYLARKGNSLAFRAIMVYGDIEDEQQLLTIIATQVNQEGRRTLIVNLSRVKRLNEIGVSALDKGRQMIEEKNGRFIIVCNNRKILSALKDLAPTGSDPFRICDSDKAAVEAVGQEIEDRVNAASAAAQSA